MKKLVLTIFLLAIITSCNTKPKINTDTLYKPNIIFIYLDDLGYGDVSAYGATELATPNMDFLANNGRKFTNGYATSATCTPSRYALLTGQYPWRNRNAKILPGTAPLLIDTAQVTLPKMLREYGYETAVIGKWHLGLGLGNVNWNKHIAPGPNEVGFDYSFIMAATQDRVPTVYIKNGDVYNLDVNDPIEIDYQKNFAGEPTGENAPHLVKMKADAQHNRTIVNGVPRIGHMKGGQSARWIDENMADDFLKEVKTYITTKKDKPFFLYYGFQQPHVPRTPHPRFIGATGMGPRGDVIAEADWCIGELIKTLEQKDLLENTLIFLSSDNGPVLDDGYVDDAIEKLGKHTPSGGLRGGKYSLYEAGTRVPFVTYWKGTINPGVSDAIISQLDWIGSLAAMFNYDLPESDSENHMGLLLGKTEVGRNDIILEATSRTAYRNADWVLIPPYPGPKMFMTKGIETGNGSKFQLYNLADDPSQENNLAEKIPQKKDEMMDRFLTIVGDAYENTNRLRFD
jgi:arylsulfatase A-like enzyme